MLLAVKEVVVGVVVIFFKSNTKSNIEVTKLQTFNREISKVLGFLTLCKLYIRIKISEITIKK